ncbi:MAG: hypothetical protein CBD97_00295 [Pelagibacteraceae bacterium TMED237]|nr:MAG: hypothetical protein CBD97_00295 [Pelagibacteraceae bacterium TMED237]|tara:strand:+ start:4019 stop:4861 length:843 start_codon:yes stop_codon:yes gene_type:complete
MKHPAEMIIHQYLDKASKGQTTVATSTVNQICKDVREAVVRQFGGGNKRDGFAFRMSNVGRPSCQLWFEKNKPQEALPKPTTFIMNMMLGDIVEAVFKGILKEAGVEYEDSRRVTLDTGERVVTGEYDIVIDGAVDDVKSASDWSYRNKFESFDTLKSGDAFGYVSQLAGYARASGKKAGGWWVVNKKDGNFKYVPADNIDVEEEVSKIKSNIKEVESGEFKRCFDPVEETFRGKPTGNKILPITCMFCSYRKSCHPSLKEMPSKVSKARDPKIVGYVNA